MIRYTDLNPHGGIGANSSLIEFGPFNIVIDSGLNPKHTGYDALPKIDALKGKHIDLVLLTHAHLDHLGSIPVIIQEHPEALLLTSKPTQILARRMLINSANVMLMQKAEKKIPAYPLYTRAQAHQTADKMVPVNFDQTRFFGGTNGERIAITFHRAGHIPGAASITLEYRHLKIFISGDILFTDQKTLPGARLPSEKVELMILETTRGTTIRPEGQTRKTETARLLKTIKETFAHGGSTLIPTFALGRMQEILTVINDALKSGELPRMPVFASGLGIELAGEFDQIARQTKEIKFSRSILKSIPARRPDHIFKPGKSPTNPALYLASSGMLVEKTLSYTLAASLLHDERNTICYTGYCDPDTPGGYILNSNPGDTLHFAALDFKTQRNARIEKFDLSSHADRDELLNFAVSCQPQNIILTHGDPEARQWFIEQFATQPFKSRVINPTPLKPINLNKPQSLPSVSAISTSP